MIEQLLQAFVNSEQGKNITDQLTAPAEAPKTRYSTSLNVANNLMALLLSTQQELDRTIAAAQRENQNHVEQIKKLQEQLRVKQSELDEAKTVKAPELVEKTDKSQEKKSGK